MKRGLFIWLAIVAVVAIVAGYIATSIGLIASHRWIHLAFIAVICGNAATVIFVCVRQFTDLLKRDTRNERRRQGRCPACDYDLRASKGRCPECGMPIPSTAMPAEKSEISN
jgi:uncharacterized paraquat-inducible protein A